MPSLLTELLHKKVHAHIQYLEIDKSTILLEKKFSGTIVAVDSENGISVKLDDGSNAISMLPPSTEACTTDDNNEFHIDWLVYRTQENRQDGQHEWWDWQPGIPSS